MGAVRLRQVALVARDLEPVVAALGTSLGLNSEDLFRDPGVGAFGLHNAVMALGDTFLEVVSPLGPGTAAGRYLERRGGDGGYMAIFQVDDLAAARRRVDELGVRVVWQSDHADIAGTHLHPKDVPGALVSVDWARPAESWRWAGPAWTGRAPDHGPGGIVGLTVQTERPSVLADRWARVLDRTVVEGERETTIAIDGGVVRFAEPTDTRGEGICAIEVTSPGRDACSVDVGGVTLRVRETD